MTYLTLEELKKRTKGYSSRSQLVRLDQSAYKSAKAQGLLDELLPSLRTPAPLTNQQVQERAVAYPTRTSFRKADDSGYEIAKRRGMLDMLFPRVVKEPKPVKQAKAPKPPKPMKVRVLRKITEELVRGSASRFSKRSHFEQGDATAAAWARKNGLMVELFPEKKFKCGSTAGFIEKAKKIHGEKFDYRYVKYNRCMEKVKIVCPVHGEFWQRPGSHIAGRGCAACLAFDNDAFYMKRAIGEVFNGLSVYKVGITSARLGAARLKQQDMTSKMKHQVVIPPTKVIGSASNIEVFALSLGVDPKYLPFDGSTEYRAFTEDEVQQIKDMVEMCRA